MSKIKFSVEINAPRKKVWDVLWDNAKYQEWTKVFAEGSKAETDWQEGSKVHFLDGQGSGMYAKIAKKVPEEFMSFQHLGVIKDGKEQPLDEETQKWSSSLENYTLKESNGTTILQVEMDTTEEFEGMFNEKMPVALDKVKELAENGF